jgi:hypothetical protein
MADWLVRCGSETVAMQSTDPRVKASEAVAARSLEGNWRPELLFVLRKSHDFAKMGFWRTCVGRITNFEINFSAR